MIKIMPLMEVVGNQLLTTAGLSDGGAGRNAVPLWQDTLRLRLTLGPASWLT